MCLDPKSGTIFLPAATVITTAAADPSQKAKHAITDGTFVVLVVSK